MCLVTSNKYGFIATTDIVVYKNLVDKTSSGNWITPCQEWRVELDSELIPDERKPEIYKYNYFGYSIQGGVIHSYLETNEETGENFFKAIIRKGTRFWINDDLSEVASERLYLTSEKVTGKEKTDLSFLYSGECLDLLTKEGKRIPWSKETKLDDIKGIFVYESQAVGLGIIKTAFSKTKKLNLPNQVSNLEKAKKNITGEDRTEALKKLYPKIEILQNLPEGSYIPALGELIKALQNLVSLNLTRQSFGLKVINSSNLFWSSTPYDEESGWFVDPDSGFYRRLGWYNYLFDGGQVLPFLDLRIDG